MLKDAACSGNSQLLTMKYDQKYSEFFAWLVAYFHYSSICQLVRIKYNLRAISFIIWWCNESKPRIAIDICLGFCKGREKGIYPPPSSNSAKKMLQNRKGEIEVHNISVWKKTENKELAFDIQELSFRHNLKEGEKTLDKKFVSTRIYLRASLWKKVYLSAEYCSYYFLHKENCTYIYFSIFRWKNYS